MVENEYLSKDKAIELLRRSVSEWNAYRESHPDYCPDFTRANFNKTNLQGANLHASNFTEANLVEANLQEGGFIGAVFTRANLRKANLHVTDLRRANFRGADLREAVLVRANLINADLFKADLIKAKLNAANFSEADLQESDLRGSDISEAYFTHSDLREANLSGANLYKAHFAGANLSGANLVRVELGGAYLNDANLSGVNLNEANLRAANLVKARLNGGDLVNANLAETNLTGAVFHAVDLNNANLSGAKIGYTTFINVDLSSVLNLETIAHYAPSFVSIDTLFISNFSISETFLEGTGIPRKLIEYLPSFKNIPIEYYSCFISYSHKDEAFATRLYEGLKSKGIRVWYAPEEMKGGRFLHDQIDQAIRLHDKLLLVLSDDSMNSTWVNTEIYKARKKERQSGKKVLFPISIVPHEKIQDWECFDADTGMDMARDIRRFYIPDFTRWKDHDSFQAEFEKLVRDLQASEEEK